MQLWVKFVGKKTKIPLNVASERVGQMRFEIMKLDPALYREVEAQINRMRLVRVLFIVEALLGIGLLWRLCSGWSWAVLAWMELVGILAYITFHAIDYRFQMYCRAIERCYKVLVLEAPEAPQTR